MTAMKIFRLFWAWEDEKEENWLREMSQKGWDFQSVSSLCQYTFEQAPTADYVYRLDFFGWRKDADKADYIQLFQDAGWEYKGQAFNGWQYFRKAIKNGEEPPQIFSDDESKTKKYQTILAVLAAALVVLIANIPVIYRVVKMGFSGILYVFVVLILFYIYAVFNLIRRIGAVKKKI